jgi:hypothetical protein
MGNRDQIRPVIIAFIAAIGVVLTVITISAIHQPMPQPAYRLEAHKTNIPLAEMSNLLNQRGVVQISCRWRSSPVSDIFAVKVCDGSKILLIPTRWYYTSRVPCSCNKKRPTQYYILWGEPRITDGLSPDRLKTFLHSCWSHRQGQIEIEYSGLPIKIEMGSQCEGIPSPGEIEFLRNIISPSYEWYKRALQT